MIPSIFLGGGGVSAQRRAGPACRGAARADRHAEGARLRQRRPRRCTTWRSWPSSSSWARSSASGSVPGSARPMTVQYATFFRLPVLPFRMRSGRRCSRPRVSLVAGSAGALGARAPRRPLPPAEAMRPPSPRSYRHTALERLGLGPLLRRARCGCGRSWSRPLRFASHVARASLSPWRSWSSGMCWRDALDHMMSVQFDAARAGRRRGDVRRIPWRLERCESSRDCRACLGGRLPGGGRARLRRRPPILPHRDPRHPGG